MSSSDISKDRKNSHLSLCLEEKVEFYSENSNGFSRYRFDHDALPELDYDAVTLETSFLGKTLAAPLIIGAMTGGTEFAGQINERMARAAEACQVGFALGSQRRLLEHPEDPAILKSYAVRQYAPQLPLLFGNLGVVQLNQGVSVSQIQSLITQAECDALSFHLNPLQEVIQPEGNRNFFELFSKLQECIPQLSVPVFLKEVGSGISETTARKIKGLPICGVETAGVGGTSWSYIESLRASTSAFQRTGNLFARWGIPTAESLVTCRALLPNQKIIASGGIRNGIEVAKAIALGADAVALALPILKAAHESTEHAIEAIQQILLELRTTLFLTGMESVAALRKRGPMVLKQMPLEQNV